MTYEDNAKLKEDIAQLVRDTVREEMRNSKHYCRFGVTSEEAKGFGRYIGSVASIGDSGTSEQGHGIMIDNHKYLYELRKNSERVKTTLIIALVTASVSAAVGGFLYNIRHFWSK